jgi:hypothetical protein
MAASSKLMAMEAERRFPVRIRIGVPPEELGRRLTEMTGWLDQNCGADGWAMTPTGMWECSPTPCRSISSTPRSRAPSSPGGAPATRSRRRRACSGSGLTNRRHGLGRGCIGRRNRHKSLRRDGRVVHGEKSPLNRYGRGIDARRRAGCAFSGWRWRERWLLPSRLRLKLGRWEWVAPAQTWRPGSRKSRVVTVRAGIQCQIERPVGCTNGEADVAGGQTAALPFGGLVRCRASLLTGSGVQMAGPLTIRLRTGEAQMGAGVIPSSIIRCTVAERVLLNKGNSIGNRGSNSSA